MLADLTFGNWPKGPPHLPVLQGELLSLALLLPSHAARSSLALGRKSPWDVHSDRYGKSPHLRRPVWGFEPQKALVQGLAKFP